MDYIQELQQKIVVCKEEISQIDNDIKHAEERTAEKIGNDSFNPFEPFDISQLLSDLSRMKDEKREKKVRLSSIEFVLNNKIITKDVLRKSRI